MINEVRIFDGLGNLKKVLSAKDVMAASDKVFFQSYRLLNREMTFKEYFCVECEASFQSNSTRGAKFCKTCRSGTYRKRKQRLRKEAKIEERQIANEKRGVYSES